MLKIAEKLTEEASRLRQPFGGVRHYLNAQLSRRRAQQLEHMHLANVFTKLGRPQAATDQASCVPATSTRILCKLECLLNEIDLMHGQQQTKGVDGEIKKGR